MPNNITHIFTGCQGYNQEKIEVLLDMEETPVERPDYATRFTGQGLGTTGKTPPISVRFSPEIDEVLRTMGNKVAYIREATIRQLRKDGLID
jgi:hypothetical protein